MPDEGICRGTNEDVDMSRVEIAAIELIATKLSYIAQMSLTLRVISSSPLPMEQPMETIQ